MNQIQVMIHQFYKDGKIEHIQKVAPGAWRAYVKKGMTDLEATNPVLKDGVKYEDLCAGWLNEGIDG